MTEDVRVIRAYIALSVGIFILIFLVALWMGRYPLEFGDVIDYFTGNLPKSSNEYKVIHELRIPRTIVAALVGIGLGLLLCLLQQQYGFVRLGESEGSFIVDAYPVSVHYTDVAIIFVTVIAVGWLAVWYPVRALSKRLLS